MNSYSLRCDNRMKVINFLLFCLLNTNLSGQKIIHTNYPSENSKVILYHIKEGIDKVREEKYFSNGIIKVRGVYQLGKKQGKWQTYHRNGRIKKIEIFNNGKLHGKTIEWYQNGIKKAEGIFFNGKRQGVFLDWRRNGSLITKQSFINGLRCYVNHYDNNGSVVNSEYYCG